jgi:hypothetical protein
MAGHPVFSHIEQGKADDAVIKNSATLSETTVLPEREHPIILTDIHPFK